MDSGSAKNAANAVAKNNRVFYAGLAGVAVVGYLWYKRNSDVRNLGDAVSIPCVYALFHAFKGRS